MFLFECEIPSAKTVAKCDEGYLCDVCGQPVERLFESDLYLRYVIGMLDPEVLHTTPERHIKCNPALAQFINDERFSAIQCTGDFDKRNLDPQFVQSREELVTRGYVRLRELARLDLPIVDYPLPEFRGKAW